MDEEEEEEEEQEGEAARPSTENNNNNNKDEEEEARFRAHMDKVAAMQANSVKSAIMAADKYQAIVQALKGPDDGTGKVAVFVDRADQYRRWVRCWGFRLQSFPEEGLEDVLVVPAREKNQEAAESGKMLRVLHTGTLFDVVKNVHNGHFSHGGYKRVLTYLQNRYYGVTRGYVQEFCSMCPTCRPHKRRSLGTEPLLPVPQAVQDIPQQQTDSSTIPIPSRLPSAEGSSAVEIIDVDEENSSSEDHALPGSSSMSVPAGVKVRKSKKTSRDRSDDAPWLTDQEGQDREGPRQHVVPYGGRSSEEEVNYETKEVTKRSKRGARSRRVQDSQTRTVVLGRDMYIVTLNPDYDLDQESGDYENVAPTKPDDFHSSSVGEEPRFCDVHPDVCPEDPVPVPVALLTEDTMKKAGRNDGRLTLEETSLIAHESVSRRSESDTSRCFTTSQHTKYGKDCVDFSIKLERTEASFTEDQTDPPNSSVFCSGYSEDHQTSGTRGQCQNSVQNDGTKASQPHKQSRAMRSPRYFSSEMPGGIVIKCEPDTADSFSGQKNHGHNVLSGNSSKTSRSTWSAKPSPDQPSPKRIKKETDSDDWQPGSSQFFQHLHVDLTDMTHLPHDDFRYICHVTDHVTKLHVLFPLRHATVPEVAAGLDLRVLTYYGMPRFLHSNRGHAFVEELIGELMRRVDACGALCNGEPADRNPGERRGAGGGTNVVEELIAMLRVERGSNSGGTTEWVSWLPRIMRSLNRDWYAALRAARSVNV